MTRMRTCQEIAKFVKHSIGRCVKTSMSCQEISEFVKHRIGRCVKTRQVPALLEMTKMIALLMAPRNSYLGICTTPVFRYVFLFLGNYGRRFMLEEDSGCSVHN